MKQRVFVTGRSRRHDGMHYAPFFEAVRQERGAAVALEFFMMFLPSDTCVSSYAEFNLIRPDR